MGFAVVTAIIYRRRVLEAVNEWIFCSHPRRPFSFSSLDTTKKAERTRTEKKKNGRNRKRTPTTNKKKTPQKETTGASSLSIVLAFDRSIRRLNWSMVFFFLAFIQFVASFLCNTPPPYRFMDSKVLHCTSSVTGLFIDFFYIFRVDHCRSSVIGSLNLSLSKEIGFHQPLLVVELGDHFCVQSMARSRPVSCCVLFAMFSP